MLDRMNRLVVFSALALTLSSAHPAPFVPASQPCGVVATFADGKTPVEIRHVSLKGNDTDGVDPRRVLSARSPGPLEASRLALPFTFTPEPILEPRS
jgi:hypothetical protein